MGPHTTMWQRGNCSPWEGHPDTHDSRKMEVRALSEDYYRPTHARRKPRSRSCTPNWIKTSDTHVSSNGSWDKDEWLSCTGSLWRGCATGKLKLGICVKEKWDLWVDMRVLWSGPFDVSWKIVMNCEGHAPREEIRTISFALLGEGQAGSLE